MKRGLAAIVFIMLAMIVRVSPAAAFDLTDPTSWPFIPVPEIATDPNGGTTVGLLPVFLFTDTQNQIRNIFAPDVNWNTTLGAGGTFRYLSYPSEDTNWYAVAGGSQDIARHVDLDYQTGRTHQTCSVTRYDSSSSAIRPSDFSGSATLPQRAIRPTTQPNSSMARARSA